MFILLLGPPGGGKGTQAARIMERLQVPQVSTGDIFRKHLKEGTELGRRAKGYMEAGALVPDELVFEIARSRLAEADCESGALLDGFPRNLDQARFLDAWLVSGGRRVDLVLNLQVPDEEVVKRLSGRRVCLDCGATYHVVFNPPTREGACDRCGSGSVVQRADDQETTILARLVAYHEQTSPIIGHYRDQGVVKDVIGVGTIDDIWGRVEAALGGSR